MYIPARWTRTGEVPWAADRSRELNAWATGGSVDGRVDVINVAPGAALPGCWGLAHELAHVLQNYTFLGPLHRGGRRHLLGDQRRVHGDAVPAHHRGPATCPPAYVGLKAAVMAGTVTGNARVEGLGRVNGGTVGGNAVVKDNALV